MIADRCCRPWVTRAGFFALGLGLSCIGTLAGSIGFVRARSAGHIYAEADVPPAPVALVLGAQVYPDGTPSPFLAARLDVAVRLFQAGRVETILVSGDSDAAEFDESAAMRAYLIDAGMPPDRIVVDSEGFDTFASCLRARQVFGAHRLTVVSQTYHLPRAVATCRALGLEANAVGDDNDGRCSPSWRRGVLRDQLASVKTVVDLMTRRG